MTVADSERLLKKLKGTLVPWLDTITGKEFMATPEDVFAAENELNRIIHEEGFGLVSEWASNLMDYREKLDNETAAWHLSCFSTCGLSEWLHFDHLFEDEHFVIIPNQSPCDGWQDCLGYGDCETENR